MQTVARDVAALHPLDPLTADEIAAAGAILKRERSLAESARFVYVTLREPSKQDVLGLKKGASLDRQAAIVLRERAERKTYEAIVSLTQDRVVSFREVEGVQPPIMLEEFMAADELVKKDPR